MGGIFLVTQNIQRGDCSSLLNPYYFCNVEGAFLPTTLWWRGSVLRMWVGRGSGGWGGGWGAVFMA